MAWTDWRSKSAAFPSALWLVKCAPSLDRYRDIARSSKMDSLARVQGAATIKVHASPREVWTTLIQAEQWPEWNPQIKRVSVEDSLMTDKTFVWGPAFPKIHSEVVVAKPYHQLIWIGTMLHFKAIHSWKLIEQGDSTLVSTEESLEGTAITWIFNQKKLNSDLNHWLGSLKARLER